MARQEQPGFYSRVNSQLTGNSQTPDTQAGRALVISWGTWQVPKGNKS